MFTSLKEVACSNEANQQFDSQNSLLKPKKILIFNLKLLRYKIIFVFFLFSISFNFLSYGQAGPTIFKGGFDNGIIVSRFVPSVWQRYSPYAPLPGDHRWRLDSNFVRQGKYSLRVELRPGDTTNIHSDRAELVSMKDSLGNKVIENGTVDSIRYYAYSIRLDSNWVSPSGGTITDGGSHGNFLQLHKISTNGNDTSGPAFSLQVTNVFYVSQHVGDVSSPVDFRYELSNNTLNRGTWIDFVVKIKYSINNSGEIIVWRRNENETLFTRVLHVSNINTLLYQVSNNVKTALDHEWHTGYYRTRQMVDGTGITNILWLDGLTIAKTAASAQYNSFDSIVVDLPADDSLCIAPIIAVSVNNVACNGANSGSIFLSSYLDISRDSIRWSGPNNFIATTRNLMNVSAGSYTYTLTTPEGCATTKVIEITEPEPLIAGAIYPAILCKGGNTTVTITANGGVLPYKGINTYTKGAGTYNFTVSDKNKCIDTAKIIVVEPEHLLGFAAVDSSIRCFGGTTTINVSALGGTMPYTGIGHFSADTGNYAYPIADANGCKDTINFFLKLQPNDLILTKDLETMVSCRGGNDGSIKLNINGGTRPYQYSFNGGSSFQNDSIKTELKAKKYSIVLKDANGCIKPLVNKIIITQPLSALTSTVCYSPNTFSLHVLGKGGTPTYKYSLDGVNFQGSNAADGGRDFPRIGFGTVQTIFVQDKNNCSLSFTINTGTVPACTAFSFLQTGVSDTKSNMKVHISPNPSAQTFNLVVDSKINKPIEINVFDMYGKKVFHSRLLSIKKCWFGENFVPGVYTLQIIQEKSSQSIKIIKL